mmetsp:Transcript_35415/g.100277  ORF Transcript_35415/g.100277 Transcript_35415/m.100277 type:complete len:360 (-) Transcript_35415:489-1568(-)
MVCQQPECLSEDTGQRQLCRGRRAPHKRVYEIFFRWRRPLVAQCGASGGEHQQASGHDDHAGKQGGSDHFVLGVVLEGHGEKLPQGDVHHHATNHPKEDCVGQGGDAIPQDEVADKAADGLSDAREQGPKEALPLAAGGVVHRHGHAHALGDVVKGDGDGEGDASARLREGGHKGSKALREVVDADGDASHYAHLLEAIVVLGAVNDKLNVRRDAELGLGGVAVGDPVTSILAGLQVLGRLAVHHTGLVRLTVLWIILPLAFQAAADGGRFLLSILRGLAMARPVGHMIDPVDKHVEQRDESNPAEKAVGCGPQGFGLGVWLPGKVLSKGIHRLHHEDLAEGHIQHDSGRDSQGRGKDP